VELPPGLGQQPGQVAQPLGIAQAHHHPVEGHGPVLPLTAEQIPGGRGRRSLGGKPHRLGFGVLRRVTTTGRHRTGTPRQVPLRQGRATVVHGQPGLVHHQPGGQRAACWQDPDRPDTHHHHHDLPFKLRRRRPARPTLEAAADQDDQWSRTPSVARDRRARAGGYCVHLPVAALESVWSVPLSASPGWPGPPSDSSSLTLTLLMSSLGRRWRGAGALGRCRGLVAQPGAPGASDVPAGVWVVGCGCVSSLLLPASPGPLAVGRSPGEAVR
jgi:hypothetical protein